MRIRLVAGAIVIAVLLLSAPGGRAEGGAFDKEVSGDLAENVKKVGFDMSGWGKVHGGPDGKGQIPYLKGLGHPPRRVALVSFYAYDPGNTKGFGSPYFGGRSEVTRQLTPDGAGVAATILHDQGIAALKERFKAHGMDLLTPDEFLDTDAKRTFFDAFEMKIGGFTAFGKALESAGKSGPARLSVVAPGYRLFRLVYGENMRPMKSADKKISVGLGSELTKGLGVDAVLVVCNLCKATKKAGVLEAVYMYMFGPNPVPGEDSFTYWPGHLYVGLRFEGIDAPILAFGKPEKVSSSFDALPGGATTSSALYEAGIVGIDLAGYERVLAALGEKAGAVMEEWTRPE